MAVSSVAALVVAALACAADLRTHRVPNMLTFGAVLAGLAFHLIDTGWSGFGWSFAGWIVGGAVFLPLFMLRGLGGGDVKLMAALGAWLGPGLAVWVALWGALAGGPIALVLAWSKGYAGQALRNLWGLLTFWRVSGIRPHPGLTLESTSAPRLPYAVPIAAGLVVTLWLH